MLKQLTVVATLALALALAGVACGSGDDDDDGTATSRSGTPGTSRAGTATSGSPASGTNVAGPSPTPQNTLTAPEQTTQAQLGSEVGGGDPNSQPVPVSTVPPITPPAGATPRVDPTQIAPPEPTTGELSMIVDMDASAPGIQATREVNRGDIFKVAIVIANAPAHNNGVGGVSAFNFILQYDKTKLVAPSISGGSPLDRNPDLNEPALGGTASSWDCLPAPEGDLDDPGGIDGDGNPATGEALLSCFTPGLGTQSGDITLAVVTFYAVEAGESELSLREVEVSDPVIIPYAHCPGDQNPPFVPCVPGRVTVR